jgi:hypothetical protein
MKYRTRTYYTDAQKAVMWEQWRQGWTLHQIAHLFNRAHTSVQGILSGREAFGGLLMLLPRNAPHAVHGESRQTLALKRSRA